MGAWKGIVGRGFSPEAFDAYAAGIQLGAWRPEFIVVHNTQIPTLAEWHDEAGGARMTGLEEYYRDTMKWSGGPHLFVADDLVWPFTPLGTPGVHSPSWNGIAWGVEMVGDYDTEPWGDAVRENTLRALAALHRLAGWTTPQLRLHREDPLTTHHCPGDNVPKAQLEAGVQTILDLTT